MCADNQVVQSRRSVLGGSHTLSRTCPPLSRVGYQGATRRSSPLSFILPSFRLFESALLRCSERHPLAHPHPTSCRCVVRWQEQSLADETEASRSIEAVRHMLENFELVGLSVAFGQAFAGARRQRPQKPGLTFGQAGKILWHTHVSWPLI